MCILNNIILCSLYFELFTMKIMYESKNFTITSRVHILRQGMGLEDPLEIGLFESEGMKPNRLGTGRGCFH